MGFPTNNYELLGVSRMATGEEIRKAYKKKALEYHPDKNPDRQAVEMFKKIQQAQLTLKDDDARARYDGQLSREDQAVLKQAHSKQAWSSHYHSPAPVAQGANANHWQQFEMGELLRRERQQIPKREELEWSAWVKAKQLQWKEEQAYQRAAAEARRKQAEQDREEEEARMRRLEAIDREIERQAQDEERNRRAARLAEDERLRDSDHAWRSAVEGFHAESRAYAHIKAGANSNWADRYVVSVRRTREAAQQLVHAASVSATGR